jgi:trans-2,3-dihydro-3-hydroxyanthranilate isomerase
LRVFTRGSVGGNHLGVVNDVTGLDGAAMQKIAFDLGFSETVFIDWKPGTVPFARIFTPADELPFAGHPLVGAAWALTVMGPGEMDRIRYREGEAAFHFEDDLMWVEVAMDGEVAPPGDVGDYLGRAGIVPVEDARRVMLPKEYVVARLPSFEAVATLAPDMDVLAERFGTLVYAREESHVRARFFAPETAVPEDPATGSAAVGLATVLAADGEPEGRLSIDQGEEMGHPSRIELSWGRGTAAIGGTVVRDEVRMLDD